MEGLGNAVKQAKIFIKIVASVRKNLIKELSSDN